MELRRASANAPRLRFRSGSQARQAVAEQQSEKPRSDEERRHCAGLPSSASRRRSASWYSDHNASIFEHYPTDGCWLHVITHPYKLFRG